MNVYLIQHLIYWCLILQHAVGLELWSMSDEIVFDNFLITDDPEVARVFALDSWDIKSNQERAASSAGVSLLLFFSLNSLTMAFIKENQD